MCFILANIDYKFLCVVHLINFLPAVCVQDGAVRLVGGNNTYSGRVEVYSTRFNTWGTVCDDSWGLIEANTACQQLGYLIGTCLVMIVCI